jgi:hypothetical protein
MSSFATAVDPVRAVNINNVWPSPFGDSTLAPAFSSIATRSAFAAFTASAIGLDPY